jgi:hypothetical protein
MTGMTVIAIALCALAGTWIIVLWGSRFLGPR